jgi:hypothetical protein
VSAHHAVGTLPRIQGVHGSGRSGIVFSLTAACLAGCHKSFVRNFRAWQSDESHTGNQFLQAGCIFWVSHEPVPVDSYDYLFECKFCFAVVEETYRY